jgi:hypothetical protein
MNKIIKIIIRLDVNSNPSRVYVERKSDFRTYYKPHLDLVNRMLYILRRKDNVTSHVIDRTQANVYGYEGSLGYVFVLHLYPASNISVDYLIAEINANG